MKIRKVIAAVLVLMMVCGFALAERSLEERRVIYEIVDTLNTDPVYCWYDAGLDIIVMTHISTEISRADWAFAGKDVRKTLVESFTDFSELHEKINSKLYPSSIDTIFRVLACDGCALVVVYNGKNITELLEYVY